MAAFRAPQKINQKLSWKTHFQIFATWTTVSAPWRSVLSSYGRQQINGAKTWQDNLSFQVLSSTFPSLRLLLAASVGRLFSKASQMFRIRELYTFFYFTFLGFGSSALLVASFGSAQIAAIEAGFPESMEVQTQSDNDPVSQSDTY